MVSSRYPSHDVLAGPSTSPDGVSAVDRAFAILFAFRPDDKGLSLADLATRTGLYKSTILRLIASLVRHHLLRRADDGRYYVGAGSLQLGALYQHSLQFADVIRPLMHRLRDTVGESVSFYVRHQNLRMCLHQVDSLHAIREHVREGDTLPMDRGSGGRVLSAFVGEPGELYERIRRDGYYISSGERNVETAGISAPVFSATQPLVGVLTLAGPRTRFDEARMLSLRPTMLETAIEASEMLGGDTRSLRGALANLNTRN